MKGAYGLPPAGKETAPHRGLLSNSKSSATDDRPISTPQPSSSCTCMQYHAVLALGLKISSVLLFRNQCDI